MEIVIEIEDYDKEWVTNGYYIPNEINGKIAEAIINGTPLPGHHGRIIDESKIERVYYHIENSENKRFRLEYTVIDGTDAPTIIEPDKGAFEKINEKQDSLRATCKAWDEAIEKDGYVN